MSKQKHTYTINTAITHNLWTRTNSTINAVRQSDLKTQIKDCVIEF